jgi:hypothetical protein
LHRNKHSSLFALNISNEEKSFATSGYFHTHFTCITYDPRKTSSAVHCVDATIQPFQNSLACFAMAIHA